MNREIGVVEGAEDEFAGDAEVVHLQALQDACGDVLGLEEALFGGGALAGVVPEGGVDATGEQGGNADAMRGCFFGEALGETAHAPFGGAIHGLTGDAAQAGRGDDVDDVTLAMGYHGAQSGLGTEDGPLQIHRKHEIDLLLGVIGNPSMAGEAGVVDPNGDFSEAVLRLADELGDGVGLADVTGTGQGAVAVQSCLSLLQGGGVDIGEHNVHARIKQGFRNGEADALSGSGDHGSLIGEVHGRQTWRESRVCQVGVVFVCRFPCFGHVMI